MSNPDAPRLRFRTREVEITDGAQLLQHIAAHEAGHAVVGIAEGLELHHIRIETVPEPHIEGGLSFGGTVFVAPNGDQNELARQRPEEMGVAMAAGVCAEEVLLGGHAKGDYVGDIRIVKEGHGWIDTASSEAEKQHRKDAIVNYSNEAYDLVVAKKEDIRAVANLLLVAGRLNGFEVDTLLS